MKVINDIDEFLDYRKSLFNKKTGFVPTMGTLHQGHLSLVNQSVIENQSTIVSIFVNPTQFDKANDFDNYPNHLQEDLALLKTAQVDCVFLPSFEQIYPDKYAYKVTENKLSKLFCGEFRDGHFDGVLTIVMKLFNLVNPTNSYFGEKDYQQLNLIQNMVKAFFMPITIVPGQTIREKDGLAMSSRNLNLTPEHRKIAPLLYQTITSDLSIEQMQNTLTQNGFKVEYIKVMSNRLLVAAKLGDVRLIDNTTYNKEKTQ